MKINHVLITCMGMCLLSCMKQNEFVSEECVGDSCNTYIVNDGDETSVVTGNPIDAGNTITAPPEPEKYWRCATGKDWDTVLCQCDLFTIEEQPTGPSACLGFSCCFMTGVYDSPVRGDCECVDMNTINFEGLTCEEIVFKWYGGKYIEELQIVSYCGEILE